MLEDRKKELQDTRLIADKLRKKLKLKKLQFDPKRLSKSRIVCKNTTCCDSKDSGNNDNEVVTIYKTHCHAVCFLDNVKEDVVADPGLIQCYAFKGQNICTVCSHRWQEHLHVVYELEEVEMTVTDTKIVRQLQDKANDMMLRRTGLWKPVSTQTL